MTSVHDTLLCNTEHINVNFENNNYHTLLKMNSDKTYPKALRPVKSAKSLKFGGRTDTVFSANLRERINRNDMSSTDLASLTHFFDIVMANLDDASSDHPADFNAFAELKESIHRFLDILQVLRTHIRERILLDTNGNTINRINIGTNTRIFRNKIPLRYATSILERIVMHIKESQVEIEFIDNMDNSDSDDDDYALEEGYNFDEDDDPYDGYSYYRSEFVPNRDDYYGDESHVGNKVTRHEYDQTLGCIADLNRVVYHYLHISKRSHIKHAKHATWEGVIELVPFLQNVNFRTRKIQLCVKIRKNNRCKDGIAVLRHLYFSYHLLECRHSLRLGFHHLSRDQNDRILARIPNTNIEEHYHVEFDRNLDRNTVGPLKQWIQKLLHVVNLLYPGVNPSSLCFIPEVITNDFRFCSIPSSSV